MLTIDFVTSAELQKDFDHALRNIIVEKMTAGDFKTPCVVNRLAQSLLRIATPSTTYVASVAAYLEKQLTEEQKQLAKEAKPTSPSISACASANVVIERIVHYELENDCQTYELSLYRAKNVHKFIINCKDTNTCLDNKLFDVDLLEDLKNLVGSRLLTLEEWIKAEKEKEAKRLLEKALSK